MVSPRSRRSSFPLAHVFLVMLMAVVALPAPTPASAVVNGDTVTVEEQHERGVAVLASTSGGCSSVLLVNDWALTAGHCVALDRTQPANVTFTLLGIAPDPDQTVTADAIYLFGGFADEVGPDLALVHLSTPLVINGSPSGFANQLWPGTSDTLVDPNVTLTIYGQGWSDCPVPPATGMGAGTYRVAELLLTDIDRAATERPIDPADPPTTFVDEAGGNYHRLEENTSSQILAPGDSGSPGIIWNEGIPYIAGITSSSNCSAGFSHQVSIPTVREWIDAVLHTQWTPGATSQPVWVLPAEVNGTDWGLTDVDTTHWAQAARAAAAMCYNRGFAGGHFDGHQGELNGNTGFGIQCSGGDTQWFDVDAKAIADTGWVFTDINTVPWAQANRAAERICAGRNQGFVGGHFSGHQRDGLYGVFCYRQGAQWFDATTDQINETGWKFATDDIDAVPWAQAARAAVGFCRDRGFSGGFLNGHHVPGLYGVVCQG
jgi:hypothetical protein